VTKKHNPAFLALVTAAKERIKEISAEDTIALLEAEEHFHLLDVREKSEFARDYCAGAVHLGKGILERDVETRFPKTDCRMILYCGGGFRSALAADALQTMGYTNVESMAGGIRAWRAAEGPLTGKQ
jgi:rhodanese-related sulfurtransferase